MELMDWKNIERESKGQITNLQVQIEIAEILLKEAESAIKKLETQQHIPEEPKK